MAPWWVPTLDAAKEWGCKPWEIAGGNKIRWYFRFLVRRDEEIKEVERLRSKK